MTQDVMVVRQATLVDESIVVLGSRAFTSQEEAAGAAAGDMRISFEASREHALDRMRVLAEHNIGGITWFRAGSELRYRIVYAVRLGDGALALPGMRVQDTEGRTGILSPRQFMDAAYDPKHIGWIGGPEAWLYVRWDDGNNERQHRQKRGTDLRSM